MAGTLFGLGLSQQFDINSKVASGCLLYIYQALSTVPVTAFKDYNLSAGQEHPWPLVADATGRIPAFWLPDGSYRARLTSKIGEPMFDLGNLLALGPSVGDVVGPPPVFDPNSILTTGDIKWRPSTGDIDGWVRCNGSHLGKTGTPGAEYTGSDATHKPLFAYLWNFFANPSNNAICPVLPSKGNQGADFDWDNGKRITLFDLRARTPFGLEAMGGDSASAGRLAGANFNVGGPNVAGANGGEGAHVLTGSEVGPHTHPTTVTDPGHKHKVLGSNQPLGQTGAGGGVHADTAPPPNPETSVDTTNITVAVNENTGGSAHNNMPGFILGTWYMRL